ncbi:hypothetical protein [Streptomyces goshikiensis]|uniref:hypothetical protein n=1 Tax=Streptomyces goshikiensis TaxID=1942 RepID=UPI002ADFD1B6|nr:hypothetical protein [Streptomyces goshikiensis]
MHAIDERLAQWAVQASRAERRAGPSVDDLGGMDEVLAAINHLADGPMLPYLVAAAGKLCRDAGPAAAEPLYDGVLSGLRGQTSHTAFAGATDALSAYPGFARALGRPLTRILLGRLADATDAGDDVVVALIGAEAADCMVQLSLADVMGASRLLGAMDEATEEPHLLPEALAVRLPRLIGVLAAHHPTAGLRKALERCLGPEHMFRDAAFELALTDLRDALEQDHYDAMAAQLRQTQDRLTELLSNSPGRVDAQLYHAAIESVLGLSAPDAPTRVPSAAADVRAALQNYRSWHRNTSTPSWARSRHSDITAWAEIALLLEAAATHMGDDDPWYGHVTPILTALLHAYTAHNTVTVLKDTPTASVVTKIVVPVIEDTFLRNENRMQYLQYALTHDEDLRDDPAARELHAALAMRSTQPSFAPDAPAPAGRADGGKDRRWHRLADLISDSAEFTDFTGHTPEHTLDRLELALRNQEGILTTIADAKYSRLLTRLVRGLEQSRDWLPDIADPFMLLLEATVRYAYMCYDVGRKMGGSYTEFLRLRDKENKKQKVDEALFHQHYRETLTYTALFRVVHSEVIDIGGGRADILFTFPTARFNVECKIEENDASEAGLRQYIAQAAEYQNTNASFAVLLVLDKTVGAEGAVNLFDSVWIENVQRQGERDACRVVIIRVPGSRDNPNHLRAAPAP